MPTYIGSYHEMYKYPCFCLNRSGGPLMDIVETSEGSRTGYLAVDAVEYANCIAVVLYNSKEENDTIRAAARFVLIFTYLS